MRVTEMELAVLISIGVLAAGLGIGLGRYVWPAVRGSDPDILVKARTEVLGSTRSASHYLPAINADGARALSIAHFSLPFVKRPH